MKRDLERLASTTFDVVVVGGGIYGLTAAYDAAQRGLTTALIERGDFGGATSFNHLKTIHGGLRYLQSGDLRRMRESIRERRTFARIAPQCVAPLPFVMPAGRGLLRHPLALQAAFAVDDLIGGARNDGLDAGHRLPPARVLSRAECQSYFGDLRPRDVAAGPGILWHDYEAVHSERLTFAFAAASAAHGAALANYVEAAGVIRIDGRIAGVTARDLLSDTSFPLRARTVVNAAGPWAGEWLSRSGIDRTWPLLKAMNLVTTRAARSTGLAAPDARGRALILLPWQGRTLVGTSESTDPRPADDQQARRSDVEAFISDANSAFPGLNLEGREVSLVHKGIVPAARRRGTLTLRGESDVLDHEADGAPEVLTLIGVKYTTARAMAERATNIVVRKLGRQSAPCRTAETPLPVVFFPDRMDAAARVRAVVENEMAQTLGDVVIRRTGVGAAGYPGDAVVNDYASAMQQMLGWSIERLTSEIASVKKFYELV